MAVALLGVKGSEGKSRQHVKGLSCVSSGIKPQVLLLLPVQPHCSSDVCGSRFSFERTVCSHLRAENVFVGFHNHIKHSSDSDSATNQQIFNWRT